MYDLALLSETDEPVENLAAEEALLEGELGARSVLFLYVNAPCVVVGRNQNPWAEASPDGKAPVLRRVSGGGAVYHDRGNLNWALIVPRSLHEREAEIALVADALAALGLPTVSGPRGGLFYAGSGRWAGAKISGTARRISAKRVLHHGTLLVNADLATLEASLGGMATSLSRALPSVPSRAANVSDICPGLGLGEIAEALSRRLTGKAAIDAEPAIDRCYAEKAAERLVRWEWTWGETPPFEVALPWSGGEACLEVRHGLVSAPSGPGAELIAGLEGRRFDYGLPEEAVRAMEAGGLRNS